MARQTCVYCGASLDADAQAVAALATRRVLRSGSLNDIEGAALGLERDRATRRYVVIDTTAATATAIATACGISAWEARQWQIAARYRLVRISSEAADGPLESSLRAAGMAVSVIDESTVRRAREPIPIESIDVSCIPAMCTLRSDTDAPAVRRGLPEREIAILISGFIQREKLKEPGTFKKAPNVRLEEAFLLHIHVRGFGQPWEIDPRRTVFGGEGLASAHMRTLQLVRRLAPDVPHDEAFRNVVPALSPGADPLSELAGFKPSPRGTAKEPRLVVLDNVAQFREYSAWRGALALAMDGEPRNHSSSGAK